MKKKKVAKKAAPKKVQPSKPQFLFDAQPPAGWSYPDHIRGDEKAKPLRLGLVGYMKRAAKKAPGFRCIVLDPYAAGLLMYTSGEGKRELEAYESRDKAVGVWLRKYLIFVNPKQKPSVRFAKTFNGHALATLFIANLGD